MRSPILRASCAAVFLALLTVFLAGCGSGPIPDLATSAAPAPSATEPAAARPEPAATAAATGAPATLVAPTAPLPVELTATPTPTPTPAPSPTTAPTASPTAEPLLGLGIAADVPQMLIGPVLQALKAAGVSAEPVTGQVAGEADLQLMNAGAEARAAAWERVFALVDRMSSVRDSIGQDELKAVWTGTGKSASFTHIYASEETAALLTPLLGEPGGNVKIVPHDALEASVWGDQKGLGVVPFDSLNVKLRAIKLNGQSPVDNRFREAEWPLTVRASLLAVTDRGRDALAAAAGNLPVTNRDAGKLTVLVMTGVTAMARNSAVAIEKSGDYGFLARVVGPELAAADITTISNEIPFVKGCVANDSPNNLVLCSKPEYWENLALSGVDAIGLSGNHLLDFGRKAALETLALYEEKKVPVYAGGTNEKAAREPLVIEHNGNRLGFLGANQYGPPVAWAGPDKPGSARFDLPTMQADIQALKPKVDVVFAEVQHLETNYKGEYVNVPNDRAEIDFRGLIDAGADVVTGVMAHAPQAVEIRDGRLILYGLGNLYFDQTWSWPTRTGLVPRHTIYDGKLINTELLVTVIEKNFQLRWATPAERAQVLKSLFDVSRW